MFGKNIFKKKKKDVNEEDNPQDGNDNKLLDRDQTADTKETTMSKGFTTTQHHNNNNNEIQVTQERRREKQQQQQQQQAQKKRTATTTKNRDESFEYEITPNDHHDHAKNAAGATEEPKLTHIGEPSSGFPSSVAIYSRCDCTEDDSDMYIDYGDEEPGDNEEEEEVDDDNAAAGATTRTITTTTTTTRTNNDPPGTFPTRNRQPSEGKTATPTKPPNRGQINPPTTKNPPRQRPNDPTSIPKRENNGNDNAVTTKNREDKKIKKGKKKTSKKKSTDGDGTRHLRNIFTKPISIVEVESWKAPYYEKSDSERSFIKKALEKNFVFSNLSDLQMKTILDAFERIKFKHGGGPVITQGDPGDYFYVVRRGMLHFEVNDVFVGNASAGQTFGELALLYTSPRAASVIPDSDCVLYRVDQTTFRQILQQHTIQTEKDKRSLLEGIPFLKDLDPMYIDKLASAMVPRKFIQGENIARKGEDATAFYVIREGKVRVKQLEIGGTTYEDHDLSAGSFFGESAILESAPREANFIGKTDGFALSIDKETFQEVLGDYEKLITKSADKKRLTGIRIIQNSYLSQATLSALAASMIEQRYPPDGCVIAAKTYTEAALYIVREGSVVVARKGEKGQVIVKGGYFGEDMMLMDLDGNPNKPPVIMNNYCVTTLNEPTTLGILTLESCRRLMDTTTIGSGRRVDFTSIVDSNIPLSALKRHTILGQGTFGQVWLVSKIAPDGTNRPYALKIQSKYELVSNDQALGVVNERNIMAELNHPFLLRLVQTYKDHKFVYMLLGLVQGGELYSVIHENKSRAALSEAHSKFYSACVFEGLAYMHKRQIVYRDLKPENVLIDFQGYPVIVDFGFAKQLQGKTFTLCGTPLYIAPEVIMNQGHDYACDHWSWAVLTYEMMARKVPHHRRGMDQLELFRAIANNIYAFPTDGSITGNVKHLIKKVLVVKTKKRLGSLAGGVDDIYSHPWFEDVDFAALRRKEIEAPWLPEITDPLDTSKFQTWDLEDVTKRTYPEISPRKHRIFNDF